MNKAKALNICIFMSMKKFWGLFVNTNMDIIGTDRGHLFQYTVFKIQALLRNK
jgi:hypothetical protein